MKQMARNHCWWFYIDKDIEFSKFCVRCHNSYCLILNKNIKAGLLQVSVGNKYILILQGHSGIAWGLIIVDVFSKFPLITKTNNTTAESTINVFLQVFLIEGPMLCPTMEHNIHLISFHDFCTAAGISHLTTIPFHTSSNGEAERFVRTFKRAMK